MTTSALTPPAIIDSHSGSKLTNTDKPFILGLALGENLSEAILRVANDANLKSATVSGLGMLQEVTVAHYDMNAKEYHTKLFSGMFDLFPSTAILPGLMANAFCIFMLSLGTDTYDVFGGHIMEATVGASAEITIIPLSDKIERRYDDRSGLKLMCPIK